MGHKKKLKNKNTSFTGSFCLNTQNRIFTKHQYFNPTSIRTDAKSLTKNSSMLHAGRYLNVKELCYLRMLLLQPTFSGTLATGHISVLIPQNT